MLLGHRYISILNLIFMIYSSKCQDLYKFVAPILDNRGAPLVAIVDTSNISIHIVRSIEIPLREIINTTIQCKINEELETLKQDIDTLWIDTKETFLHELEERKNFTKIVHTVKVDLDEKVQNSSKTVDLMKLEFQQKIDEHIGDNRDQFADVNQNIATLQKNTKDTISHEILGQRENMTKTIDNVKKDLVEKIDEHIGDNQNKFTEVKQDIATLRKEIEEKIDNEILQKIKNFTSMVNTVNKVNEKMKNLTNHVEIMQSELRKTILSVNNNASNLSEQLETHSKRLDALRSNIQELTVNTNAIRSGMNGVRSTASVNNERLGGHESRLDDLNDKVNAINSRAFLSAWVPTQKTMASGEVISFTTVNARHGISSASSMTSRGQFTCEKAGYYLVSFFVSSKSLKAEAILYKNSSKLARAIKSGDDNYESHAAMTITQLNVGDNLYVKAHTNDMNVYNTYDSGFTILQIY
ncbi:uncharacterized protein R10E11.5-like [Mytilus edulis]|uniref:uncharacterized protein R10E11.5-like n=1 Tax=Mytilus edulis TaxID=6550 RepID=UPI0039F0630F